MMQNVWHSADTHYVLSTEGWPGWVDLGGKPSVQ